MSARDFDVVVLGAGFAGSLMAMILHRLGRSVVLIERGQHPRFAIGESSTPLANSLLEEICDRYDLPRLRPLSKWGTWQREYPDVGCGLKRGFSFFHHARGQSFRPDAEHRNQLLVAASSANDSADTHWYRPDFDYHFVREAQATGIEYVDQFKLERCACGTDNVQLEGTRLEVQQTLRARFIIDASGPRGGLYRALSLSEQPFAYLPPTQALFNHFRGVRRLEDLRILPPGDEPPYPIDDAALHHVFDGGWIWVLRFNNGLTSAGVAMTAPCAEKLHLSEGSAAWARLLELFPTVREQFRDAKPERPFDYMPRLSFRSAQVTGPNWALLPSAAGFVDPLLSTGFTLTLNGVLGLAQLFERHWNKRSFSDGLKAYEQRTQAELSTVERLVGALYRTMSDFPTFALLARLYFAPVSYAEIARRMGRPELASSFLMRDHPEFGPRFFAACEEAGRGQPGGASGVREELMSQVLAAIAPFDLIGLSDMNRKNWYGSHPDEMDRAAARLGIEPAAAEGISSPRRSGRRPG